MTRRRTFNPPPGWPSPPADWTPPRGWSPDPAWPEPPPGWRLWLTDGVGDAEAIRDEPRAPDRPTRRPVERPPPLPAVHAAPDARVAALEAENAALRARIDAMNAADEAIPLDDEAVLQEVGIYRYHHPLENAVAYKERLRELSQRIARLARTGAAIEKSNMFTFDNSLAKGRKMTDDLGKLMARAYNAEADNCIRSLRAGSVSTARKRMEASRKAIAKLGAMMQMQVSDAYHALRIEEIELTADFLMKKQEQREAAREERARLREERRVQAELAAEREQLDKEHQHLMNALAALRAAGTSDADLEARLAAIDDALARNDYRTANIRAGYVYVISNRGAFGEDVIKIGLTRRLEPSERISELSGASVPFRFDVHALYFSEDAVTLESELHQYFSDRRLNHANARKEFFFVSPAEVQAVLASKVGNLLEFTEQAESAEYLQSVRMWPGDRRR